MCTFMQNINHNINLHWEQINMLWIAWKALEMSFQTSWFSSTSSFLSQSGNSVQDHSSLCKTAACTCCLWYRGTQLPWFGRESHSSEQASGHSGILLLSSSTQHMQQCGQQGAVPKLLGPGQWAHTGPYAMAQEQFRSILQHSPAATCLH